MKTYKDWSPTQHDTKGLNLPDRQDWFVAPLLRNRDSKVLDESNFQTALRMLGGESDSVEVHRFNHWACGWFEIILCAPEKLQTLESIQDSLEQYPILDENDYSEREMSAADETWASMSIKDRVWACAKYGASIFAARRNEVPQSSTGELDSYLAGELS